MKLLFRVFFALIPVSLALQPLDLHAQCVAGCTTSVDVKIGFSSDYAKEAIFTVGEDEVKDSGSLTIKLNPAGGGTVSGSVSLQAEEEPFYPPGASLSLPCGVEARVTPPGTRDWESGSVGISLLEFAPGKKESFSVQFRIKPPERPQGGSSSPNGSSYNPGAPSGGGGMPSSVQVYPSVSGGLTVEVPPHTIDARMPLGFGAALGGTREGIGYLTMNYKMGGASLGFSSIGVNSSGFDSLEPTEEENEVKWVATTGNPRILLAPDGAFKVTELDDAGGGVDTSRGVKVEVFPRSAFNEGTSSLDSGAAAVSTYWYDRLVGGDEVTVSEWVGVPATGAATKTTVYALAGGVFSETSGGYRKETVVEQNFVTPTTSIDPNNETAVRGGYKKVTTKNYEVLPGADELLSMTIESYGYIPVREVDGSSFGAIVGVEEVLKSRRTDLDGNSTTIELEEKWYYYGEETGTNALSVDNYYMLGREKLHEAADGNWSLTGYGQAEALEKTIVFSPWGNTAPPGNPGTIGVVGAGTVVSYPVKRIDTETLSYPDTRTVTVTTYHVSGESESKIIGEEVTNQDLGPSGVQEADGASFSIDGKRMTHRVEYLGSWAPGTGDGNAWTEFNTSASSKTHRMVVTTYGVSHPGAIRYSGRVTVEKSGETLELRAEMGVVPGLSTQEIEITGGNGVVLRETRVLPPGLTTIGEVDPENPPDPENPQDPVNPNLSFVPATRQTYAYDGAGRQIEVRQDGRILNSTSYPAPHVTLSIDEQGIATETETDSQGRVVRTTVEAGGGVPAINHTTEYSGLVTTSRTNGTMTGTEEIDRAGRIVSRTDATGAEVLYTYSLASGGGLVVTETYPGGLTSQTETYRDGRPKQITGTAVVGRYYEYGIEADVSPNTTKAFQLETERTGAANSLRLRTTVTHWNGGGIKEVRVPNAATANGTPYVLNSPNDASAAGYSLQSVAVSGGSASAGMVSYAADDAAGAMGMHTVSGKVAGWSSPASPGQTRLAHTQQSYVEHQGRWWRKTLTTQGQESTQATRQQYTMTRLWQQDGDKSISVNGGEEITTTTTYDRGAKATTQTIASNRSSIAEITFSVNGYVQWQQSRYSTDVARRATFAYDSFGRLMTAKDHRGGVTRTVYNAVGQVEKSIDSLGRATTYTYVAWDQKNAGRVDTITKPDGTTTVHTYTDRGEIATTSGTAEYPQTFTYNSFGQRHSVKTTRANGAGTKDVYTLWAYNAAGLVSAKYYGMSTTTIPSSAPTGTLLYTYDPFGSLLAKAVQGGKTTSYTNNVFGELLTINYGNDGSGADVTLTRDGAGLVTQAEEAYENASGAEMGGGTTAYTYTAGNLDSVSYSSGHNYLPGVSLTYKTRDAEGRPAGYEVAAGSTQRLDVGYGYDGSGRLSTVSSGHGTFTYGYHAGSGIVAGYSGNSGGTVISQSRPVDFQNRISSVTTKNGSGQVLASVAYSHDKADRRTQARREDGSYWSYAYNARGEVTGAQRYSTANTAINGLERQYDYDPIGNRKWAKSGGGATGALSQTTYTPNDFNQFESIATPDKAWVVGRAPLGDTVQVNSAAAGRQEDWFSRELTVANSTRPIGQSVTVADAGGTTVASGKLDVRQQSVSKSAGTLDYDAAGNLVKDGRWEYQWDSENRLRQMKATTTAVDGGLTAETIDFVYDWQGKRIGKKVTQGSVIRQTRYLYEGWNVVAEWTLHGSSSTLATPQTYLWGLDLAGQQSGDTDQLQGAGGVGGLLSVDVRKVSDSTAAGKLYASYDGNGNILAWSGADGVVRRSQDYDAFGNVVLKNTDAVTGPFAANQGEVGYGFSTKPEEKESGLLYYGWRYYDPMRGRWLSKDPIGEKGGRNLYGFVENDSVNEIDFLGLVLRPGGAVANLVQIPAIMRKKGFNVAATTMDRWFSRAMGDTSPVDDILTVKWAEGFSQFNAAVSVIKGTATSSNAAKELRSKLTAYGLLVTGSSFDHTVGKASAQEKYYYQSTPITKHTEDDFGFAVGATNIHMVAKGYVSDTSICVSEVGYYLIDPYRFNEPENQRLGVWDFNEMEYEGYIESWTSGGEFRIFNSDFIEWSLKNKRGADFYNYSDIKTYSLGSIWEISR